MKYGHAGVPLPLGARVRREGCTMQATVSYGGGDFFPARLRRAGGFIPLLHPLDTPKIMIVHMTLWVVRGAQRTHTRSNTRALTLIPAPSKIPIQLSTPDLPRVFSGGVLFSPCQIAMDPSFGGFWGGSCFAPGHARRPFSGSAGGAPGTSKKVRREVVGAGSHQ